MGADGETGKGEVIYSDEEDEDEKEEAVVSRKKQRKLAVRPFPCHSSLRPVH